MNNTVFFLKHIAYKSQMTMAETIHLAPSVKYACYGLCSGSHYPTIWHTLCKTATSSYLRSPHRGSGNVGNSSTIYPIKHPFCFGVVMSSARMLCICTIHSLISFRFISLGLGQSYHCPGPVKNPDECEQNQLITSHKTRKRKWYAWFLGCSMQTKPHFVQL